MNHLFLVGNITGDIYYDRLLIKGAERPMLRLILMSSRPRHIAGMRVVLWDKAADLYYPYMQRGAEVAVVGGLQTRSFKNKTIHEIEAQSMILLRNINWEHGEAERHQRGLDKPEGSLNHAFIVGEVGKDIYFNWFDRHTGDGQYAFLRLRLNNEQYLSGLRVSVRGSLAEIAYPYLQPGSKIAVDGHIQTRDRETGKKVVEVTAEHLTFLENINWAAGEAAKSQPFIASAGP